jgi:hypothetical protein
MTALHITAVKGLGTGNVRLGSCLTAAINSCHVSLVVLTIKCRVSNNVRMYPDVGRRVNFAPSIY